MSPEVVKKKLKSLTSYLNDLIPFTAKGEPAPASYRAAFLRAGELGIISKKLSRNLALSAGLRNILAHEYEEVDYKTVHKSIPVAIRDFTKLLKELF